MRRLRLPHHVVKGKVYEVHRFDPKTGKWKRELVKVVDIYENDPGDGSPGAQIIVCHRVKVL